MPVKNVELIPGNFYHIYNRSVEGSLLFREGKNYDFFLDKVKVCLSPVGDILAFCLMPSHYHFLIRLTKQGLSKAMQKLALSYVVAYNRTYNRRGRLFSSPYQRIHIRNLNYLLELSRYIHLNPVKAGLVKDLGEWKYSSYAEFIGRKELDFINPAYILDVLSDDITSSIIEQQSAYKTYVNQGVNQIRKDEVL